MNLLCWLFGHKPGKEYYIPLVGHYRICRRCKRFIFEQGGEGGMNAGRR